MQIDKMAPSSAFDAVSAFHRRIFSGGFYSIAIFCIPIIKYNEFVIQYANDYSHILLYVAPIALFAIYTIGYIYEQIVLHILMPGWLYHYRKNYIAKIIFKTRGQNVRLFFQPVLYQISMWYMPLWYGFVGSHTKPLRGGKPLSFGHYVRKMNSRGLRIIARQINSNYFYDVERVSYYDSKSIPDCVAKILSYRVATVKNNIIYSSTLINIIFLLGGIAFSSFIINIMSIEQAGFGENAFYTYVVSHWSFSFLLHSFCHIRLFMFLLLLHQTFIEHRLVSYLMTSG